jgi:hypothetical protein
VDTNMDQTLLILLEAKAEFPVNDFNKILLRQIASSRAILIKSFSFLTDIINNPEECIKNQDYDNISDLCGRRKHDGQRILVHRSATQ